MKQFGVSRPLLWFYNPQLAGLYAALPGAYRVFHATENFFHFEQVSDFFLAQTKASLHISDLVVAVSSGVAASISQEVPLANVRVITNGCDFQHYATYQVDEALLALRGTHARIAIYAGNINSRLDFGLLHKCSESLPAILFAFFGPVAGLLGRDRQRWKALTKRPNVHYFGPVDPDALPGLYGAADVGLIPYKTDRFLVENGFPLKALEMGATGLPVVSSHMRPIANLCSALVVCRSDDAFVAAVRAQYRGALTVQERHELRDVCEKNDYSRKFEELLNLISWPERSCIDQIRTDELLSALQHYKLGQGFTRSVRSWLHARLLATDRRIPQALRAWVPLSTRRRLKNWLDRP